MLRGVPSFAVEEAVRAVLANRFPGLLFQLSGAFGPGSDRLRPRTRILLARVGRASTTFERSQQNQQSREEQSETGGERRVAGPGRFHGDD